MPLKAALGSFLNEFNKFETLGVRAALRSLSRDAEFADRSEKLLDLEARLTLLNRIAFSRNVAPQVIADLDDLLSRARKLRPLRDKIARMPLSVADTSWIPPAEQLQQFTNEVVQLNGSLCAISDQVNLPVDSERP